MNICLIDNYDSFTFNLEHLLVKATGAFPAVVRYEKLRELDLANFDLMVISPGPKAPSDYPEYRRVFTSPVPILGICLGMQIINEQFGGTTARLENCVHGKTENIEFDGKRLRVARYHSLGSETIGEHLEVIAATTPASPWQLPIRPDRL